MKSTEGALLIVISAPSGCGKTTIVDRLLKRHPDWIRSVSATTRKPRDGEKDGEEYLFLSPAQFAWLRRRGGLLESAKVFGCSYGTPKNFVLEHLKKGRNVVLAIDVQGARQIRRMAGKKLPLVSVFILPPSLKVLRDRLEGRHTDSSDEIEKRLAIAQKEIKEAGAYAFAVVNQSLEQAVIEVEHCVEKFSLERRKKKNVIRIH